jgi:hypothetical protein
MKQILLIIFIIINVSNLKSQTFNGKIIYESDYSNIKIDGLTNSDLKTAMGSIEEFFVHMGNHLTISNGTIMDWVLYRKEASKVYFKMKDEKNVHFKDSNIFKKKLYKIEYYYENFKFLDYDCKKIVIHFGDNTKITSYYAPKLYVDSKLFKKDKYDGFYLLFSKTNSISLKTIYESKEYTKTVIAREIVKQNISMKKFNLPKELDVIKAPW